MYSFRDLIWKPQDTSINWKSYASGILSLPVGGPVSASLIVGGLQGLNPTESLSGALEGIMHGVNSGYYKCYASCMASTLIPLPAKLYGEHYLAHNAYEIMKQTLLLPKSQINLIQLKGLLSKAKNYARGFSGVMKGAGVLTWVSVSWNNYNCVQKCLCKL